MRQEKIQILKNMADSFDVDAIVVFSPAWRKENFRYVTSENFFGPYAMVVYLRTSGRILIFHSSEFDKTRTQKKLANIDAFFVLDQNWSGFSDIFSKEGVKKIGVAGYKFFPGALAYLLSLSGIETKNSDGYIEKMRLRKTPQEVEYLRAAVNLADKAFPVFVDSIDRGLNEFQIVAEVEFALKKMGAEDNFMLISTGGKEVYGMTPPQNRIAKPGDMVLTELTPQLNGWWCQICRTVVKGKPSDDQLRVFEIFKEAEEAGLNLVKPGVNINDVARAENDVFRKYGFGEFTTPRYTRVRGHGHGMHLDEDPTVNEGVDMKIEEGMVIVIHPNTYNPLTGYMVLGDPVVVTPDGNMLLSTTERKLFHT